MKLKNVGSVCKLASPMTSITGSPSSLYRDSEREIKVLQYSEVLDTRIRAQVYNERPARRAYLVCTNGTGRAP